MTPAESFSDAESYLGDYQRLSTAGGFVELKHWSTVTMTGEDRQSFLHNMCSNDIRRLSTGEGCEAYCTDVKGKLVAHVYVLARDAQLDLLTVPEQAATLIAHLDRYIIREDVQLQDQSGETCWLWVAAALPAGVLTELGITADLENPWQNTSRSIAGVECLIARCDLLRSTGFLLGCGSQSLTQVKQRLAAIGAPECTAAAWNALRIESGLPLFGTDFSTSNLPQEVDRDGQAISFNKGCYLGQETIARIDALGHVNQKVVLVQFAATLAAEGERAAIPEAGVPEAGVPEAGVPEAGVPEAGVAKAGVPKASIPEAGMELTVAGKCVGHVTSGCWSPHLNAPLALATVRRGSNQTGSQLESALGVGTVIAPLVNAG